MRVKFRDSMRNVAWVLRALTLQWTTIDKDTNKRRTELTVIIGGKGSQYGARTLSLLDISPQDICPFGGKRPGEQMSGGGKCPTIHSADPISQCYLPGSTISRLISMFN